MTFQWLSVHWDQSDPENEVVCSLSLAKKWPLLIRFPYTKTHLGQIQRKPNNLPLFFLQMRYEPKQTQGEHTNSMQILPLVES